MPEETQANGRDASRVSLKLRTPAAAEHLGLAPATLAKLRCVGGGPLFTKLGRAVVYTVDDLEQWVAAQGKRRSTCDE
jgi:hypothetical protein